MYSFARGSLNFHGGKLCVKAPFARLLTAGAEVVAQWRDPCAGFGDSLTNGVEFSICP